MMTAEISYARFYHDEDGVMHAYGMRVKCDCEAPGPWINQGRYLEVENERDQHNTRPNHSPSSRSARRGGEPCE